MTYARARLWLGISGVGTIVVAAGLALVFDLPAQAGMATPGLWWRDWLNFGLLWLGYVLLSAPFDYLGGYHLPCQFGRSCLMLPVFAWRWVRGIATQGFVMTASAMLLLTAGRLGGRLAALAMLLVLQLLLVSFQRELGQLVGALENSKVAGREGEQTLSGLDPGFAGGLTGLPGQETIVMPGHWSRQLDQDDLTVERLRREGALKTGSRARGVLLAAGWNLAGFLLCTYLPAAGVDSAGGMVTTILGFTLWSFVGLILLPTASRPGVLEADRYALEHGTSREALTRTISLLDQLQDDEPVRGRWIEWVFHPVPSVKERARRFADAGSARRGAWHAARMALYLSWASFGMLSRAVHCNSGRPELWVMLPGD